MSKKWIPYGHQYIDEEDIEAVVRVLRSNWLTTGPEVERFEKALAEYCGAKYAVVLNSGTAALHAAYFAAGVGPGDEVITSPLTFAATANAALYLGAKVIFSDVLLDTGNLDPKELRRNIGSHTKAVVPVDYAGHPADLEEIIEIAHRHGAVVIEDACHALGAAYKGRRVGSIADLTVFSFHPVKHITTAEGGAVLTDNEQYFKRLQSFRAHGIFKGESGEPWYYEMRHLGYNYRLSDIQCALGYSQLRKLSWFLSVRRRLANLYSEKLAHCEGIKVPVVRECVNPAWHLYVIRVDNSRHRRRLVNLLHNRRVGVQVHYIPVYYHPYYQRHRQLWDGHCQNAELFYATCLSLPLFPGLSEERVIEIANYIMELTRRDFHE